MESLKKNFYLHTHRAVDLACPAKYVVRWEGGGAKKPDG
jgi:hypothetical protein